MSYGGQWDGGSPVPTTERIIRKLLVHSRGLLDDVCGARCRPHYFSGAIFRYTVPDFSSKMCAETRAHVVLFFLFAGTHHCMSPHAAVQLHTSCVTRLSEAFWDKNAEGAEASLSCPRGVSKWSHGYGAHGPSLPFLSLTALLDSRACQEGRTGL